MNLQIKEIRTAVIATDGIATCEPYFRDEVSLPCCVYEIISDDVEPSLTDGGRLHRTAMDLRLLDDDMADLEDLAVEVGEEIDGYDDFDDVRSLFRVSADRAYDMPIEGSNVPIYSITISVVFWWSE